MEEVIICEGCGAEVEVDVAFGVSKSIEVAYNTHPGRVTISEGNKAIHQCADGAYSPPES